MFRLCIQSFIFSLVVWFSSGVMAGNLSLIEKRLQELDKLNKEAVEKAGPIPQYGSVEINAKVMPSGRYVKDMPGVTETRFDFGKKTVLALEQTAPFTVQISSSQSKERCFNVANLLRRAGYPAFTASISLQDQGIWYRIFVGSYATMEEAEKIKEALLADEISDGLIRSLPYAIQVGQAGSPETLAETREQLVSLYYMPYTGYLIDTATKETKTRLLVGAFKSKEDTAGLLAELRQAGLEARVVNR